MRKLWIYGRFALVLGTCCLLVLNTSPVWADRDDELKSIFTETPLYDTSGDFCGVGGSSNQAPTSGKNVFILGDSITNQSRAEITIAAQTAGYTITGIDADPGRAISSDTSPPGTSGLAAIADAANAEAIKNADVAIIALGTNSGVEELNEQIPALATTLRSTKETLTNGAGSIQIFWVNLFYTSGSGPVERNQKISDNSAAEKSDYKIIDTTNAGIELDADGTHPTAVGNTKFAETLFAGLNSHSPAGPEASGGTRVLTYPNFRNEAAAAKSIDDYIAAKYPASPFNGLGKYFIASGKRSNVNPFLAAGHLQVENGFATASRGWHALNPPTYNAFGATGTVPPTTTYTSNAGGKQTTYSVIIWPSWVASLDSTVENSREDFFEAIRRKYLNPGSMYESHTFEKYISHYAPDSAGNKESVYINNLYSVIDALSAGIGLTGQPTAGCASAPIATGKYHFPLAPQTRAVSGIRVDQTAATHHDGTPAFDLFSPLVRAKVYAIYDGTPVTINTNFNGVPGCASIQFQADDGFFYWYGHLENVLVQEGVHIASGTPMAHIADKPNFTSQCYGGYPHLHIDRGCTIGTTPQRGGSDACRDPSFIPFLSDIYKGLQ